MKLVWSVLSYLLFVIIIGILPWWLNNNGHADLLIPHFWLFFFFLSGLTLAVVTAVIASQSADAEKGTQVFLAATVFKILACLVFALVFLLKNKLNKYVFIADFFYVYFLNMAFEVYSLLRNLRNQNLRSKTSFE